jgi:aarF domain-containing kinase
MVFFDSFVHSDLHPGNVLVQTSTVQVKPSLSWWGTASADGVREETKRTIVFLDAGLATSLSPTDHRNLLDLFRAVILNQGDSAGRLMVERAKYERCSQVEGGVDAFAKGIDELVSEFHDRRKEGLTLGAVRIGSLLSRVLDLCRVHGVEIDPAMANIVISTLVLEGLGRSLEPNLNLIDFALPFVIGRGRV